jgi:hypothetical protein
MMVVTGATGNVGREVVKLLLESGEKVVALTRNPGKAALPEGAVVVGVDLSHLQQLSQVLRDVEAILISPRALGDATAGAATAELLQLARRAREVYVGPWLPEPILTEELGDPAHPDSRVELEESISLAFLVLLEQLQPFERAVFLLHEVFEYPFAEIAAMLGKSEVACRSSFSRAKHHLRAHRPRFTPAPDQHRQLLASFLQAVQGGDLNSLTQLLSEEVILWVDRWRGENQNRRAASDFRARSGGTHQPQNKALLAREHTL